MSSGSSEMSLSVCQCASCGASVCRVSACRRVSVQRVACGVSRVVSRRGGVLSGRA